MNVFNNHELIVYLIMMYEETVFKHDTQKDVTFTCTANFIHSLSAYNFDQKNNVFM